MDVFSKIAAMVNSESDPDRLAEYRDKNRQGYDAALETVNATRARLTKKLEGALAKLSYQAREMVEPLMRSAHDMAMAKLDTVDTMLTASYSRLDRMIVERQQKISGEVANA